VKLTIPELALVVLALDPASAAQEAPEVAP